MGTTTTTNLALIKPDTDEKIKEELPTFAGWAAQNAINCDKIDGLFRASNTTYSPTWSAVTTPPTLGAGGFVEGKYLRLWPRLVIGYFRIFAGAAGFNAGSGAYTLTLPATVPTEFPTLSTSVPIGKAVLLDADVVLSSDLLLPQYIAASGLMQLFIPLGGAWSNTNPITLAQNDRVSGYFMYPTSDA